ncbi:MAG: radical SAM protein [Bacillota bacterium]
MKILLIVPRYLATTEPYYQYAFPIGLASISQVIKNAGHNVDCLNLNHERGIAKDIINHALDTRRYDVICTGNNALGYSITETILKTARNHDSHPKTILGGPIISSEPELVYRMLGPDYGVIGEGEGTVVELLDFIKNHKDLNNVQGIIFSEKGGRVVQTPNRKPIDDLDSLPFPDYEGLGYSEQLKNMCTNYSIATFIFDNPRVYPLLASRSCPFQCTFCYHDGKYRKRSLDRVMEELNFVVRKHNINILAIYDDCFSIDKERLLDFCRRMHELRNEVGRDIKWMCQLMVSTVDRSVLKIMKEAGCFMVSYGFESYSLTVLRSMRKYITPEQIDRAYKDTLKEGINVQANFIFGDVAETKETAKITLNYWKKNCRGQVSLGFIQPYPGSAIYQHCLNKGIIKDKEDFIRNRIREELWLNMTDKMTDKEIAGLRKEILMLTSKYTKFVSPKRIKRMGKDVYSVKIECPFCRKNNEFKNCLIMNKLTYRFAALCRYCNLRFNIVSFLQKIALKNYSKTERLLAHYAKIMVFLRKSRF